MNFELIGLFLTPKVAIYGEFFQLPRARRHVIPGYIWHTPFQGLGLETTDVDEERRLFYVSMTRAQERLYLTFADKRKLYGKTKARIISPFFEEIENCLKMQEKSNPGQKRKNSATQLKLF